MKKILTYAVAITLCSRLFAGGIVTNTNQSASWVRMPAQDASVGIPAVYYNPAGLMKLDNGIHISVSNQTIFQKRKIENFYTGPGEKYGLNTPLFEGSVKAPLFPSVYAVYKMDKLAFSFGFNPVGGGGGATFDKGLPSLEISPSDLVPSLASYGVTDYRLKAEFIGKSVFFGYQAGISYKISEELSVYAGVRLVTAKNSYEGKLQDIEIYNFGMASSWLKANEVISGIAAPLGEAASGTTDIVAGGGGALTLAQAEGLGIIDSDQRTALEGGLTALGYPTTLNIATANQIFKGAYKKYSETALLLANQSADVTQKGSGITPVIGINITPSDKLNIGIKYEFMTKLELTNDTKKDFTTGYTATGYPVGTPITMFPDGAKTRNDMPSMLSIGVSAKATSKLSVNVGGHWYNDRGANYGKKINEISVDNKEVIDNNFFEFAAGLEYSITDKLLVSGGYLLAQTGVNKDYQSDLSYSLTSNTLGAGGAYRVTDNIEVNLGIGYTTYDKDEKWILHKFSSTGAYIPAKETYYKDNMFIGVGVDFSF